MDRISFTSSSKPAKQLAIRLLIFAAPILLAMGGLALVDPFSFFWNSNFISKDKKECAAANIDNAFYKLIRFNRNPHQNIIIGDSRMYKLDSTQIHRVSGLPYFNLAIFGASFEEIAEAFWFAAERNDLKNVVIGLNFLLWNENFKRNRVQNSISKFENPLLYFCDFNLIKIIYSAIFQNQAQEILLGDPGKSKDEFWRYVLYDETVPGYLRNYRYPIQYEKELLRIRDFCIAKGIKLLCVIPPTHIDLQNRVVDFGLKNEENRFKDFVASTVPNKDFEFENELTRNKENFKDPMHYSPEIGRFLVQEIWGKPGSPELIRHH